MTSFARWNRVVALAVVVIQAQAWGQTAEVAGSTRTSALSTARLSVSFGGTAPDQSNFVVSTGGVTTAISAADFLSAPQVRVAGSYFFKDWLGVNLEGSFEHLKVQRFVNDAVSGPEVGLTGYRLHVQAAGRYPVMDRIGLEARLGLGAGQAPGVFPSAADTDSQTTDFSFGPVGTVAVVSEPWGPVSGQVYVTGAWAPAGGISGTPATPSHKVGSGWYGAGAQLAVGGFTVGSYDLALALDVSWTRAVSNGGDWFYKQKELRAGLGLMAVLPGPRSMPTTGSVRGRVQLGEGGGPASGARVEAGGLVASTDASGEFELSGIAPGSATVRASAEGLRPALSEVRVSAGGVAEVALTLVPATGPGTVKGTVKAASPEAALAGAEVSTEGQPAVRTAKDGTFVLPGVGPGLVTVRVKAEGYALGEDVVQVPPEGEATVPFLLKKQGEKTPATLRGLIRLAGGKTAKVSVRVDELHRDVPLNADGRFSLELPGGKYTLVIDAPGFVAQVKKVEIAAGDQAIIHCELQPAPR